MSHFVKSIFHLFLFLMTTICLCCHCQADLVNFEALPLGPDSFYNGGPDTNANGWDAPSESGRIAHFGNNYNSAFGGFWNGFSYSNVVDSTTAGFGNQYAAFPGSGANGSEKYAVGFAGSDAFLNLPGNQRFTSIDITNTTYAAISIRDGDQFGKKFGGDSGDDPDFFSIVFTGYSGLNGTGSETGSTEYFLADYRFADNNLDYIIDSWQTVSLAPLNGARSFRFSFTSSDVGQFGINTPTYFALDNVQFATVPEPSTSVLWFSIGFAFLRRNRNGGR